MWARLTNFNSSGDTGVFFIPVGGDEVIVGFLNDDPKFPIILGSHYSSSIQPVAGLPPTEENNLKAIVTKSGLQLVFKTKINRFL